MKALAIPVANRPRSLVPLLFVGGFVVLLAAWALLFWTESIFTESHLVGYYCCAAETDLPAPGTLERTLSDFFQASLGEHLPSLLFVGGNIALFAWPLRRERRLVWWLPWLFILFTVIYVLVDFELLVFSWSISNRIVGPRTSPYAGYGRTWYGIALHLALWTAYFVALACLLRKLLPKTQPD
ncbi:MAG: hypothetical protein GWN58_46450, partial [Anaerolineae bacterium]|nr:hypothetical protein [Anaerolineae bacterium]